MLPFSISLFLSIFFVQTICFSGLYLVGAAAAAAATTQWSDELLIVQADAFNEVIQYRATQTDFIEKEKNEPWILTWSSSTSVNSSHQLAKEYIVDNGKMNDSICYRHKNFFKSSYILIGSTFYVRSIWLQPGTL